MAATVSSCGSTPAARAMLFQAFWRKKLLRKAMSMS